MFPLTDLSILFTALLIITFAILGIFILFGMFIHNTRVRHHFHHPFTLPDGNAQQRPVVPPTNITISDWVTFLST
jgi:hypothetical protein